MATYNGVLLDLMYLNQGIDKSRFLLNFEVDSPGNGQLGRWRQNPKNNRTYWKTSGGNYNIVADGLIGRGISKYDINFKDNSSFNRTALKFEDALMSYQSDFPNINQKGIGYLYEAPEFGASLSPAGTKQSPIKPNVFWAITNRQQSQVEDTNMWIGGGIKYGGEIGVKADLVQGYIVNVKDPSKRRYFQCETKGISFGVGGQGGVVVILVNAQNPSVLLNTSSAGFDWSLCLGGALSKLIKPLLKVDDACKFVKVAELAHKIYKQNGILQNDEFWTVSGHLKSLFSGSALESSPNCCVIDTPLSGGLAVGISYANSKITRI